VEGAECGWRVGYQHISKPRDTGPLLMEDMMAVEKDATIYYNTQPITHMGNGAYGCTLYRGLGRPESRNGHCLASDSRGGQGNRVELGALLAHADQRVRQEAQFELADRGLDSLRPLTLASQKQPITSTFDSSRPDLAQLHGIWGIGQLARKDPKIAHRLIPLL